MSDVVILAIITSLTTILTVVINGIINARSVKKRIGDVSDRVDKYNLDVNGNMKQLLETTKSLGAAEARAEDQEKRGKKPKA